MEAATKKKRRIKIKSCMKFYCVRSRNARKNALFDDSSAGKLFLYPKNFMAWFSFLV